jgi:hypothetical protein
VVALKLDRVDGAPMTRQGTQVVARCTVPDSNRMVLMKPTDLESGTREVRVGEGYL